MKEIALDGGPAIKNDIEEVFERYRDMVFRLAFVRTKSGADADDIVQETFLRYLRSCPDIQSEQEKKAWLIRVAVNCTTSLLRRVFRLHDDIPGSEGQEDEALKIIENQSDVYKHVLKLPENQRTAIHLYYYEDYSVKEIAELLNCGESAAKSYLKRGRDKLKAMIEEADL